MQMEHHLPPGLLVELLNRKALGLHARLDGARHFLDGRHEAGEVLRRNIENIERWNLRYDERMSFRARHDVHECERSLILIDFDARRLAAQNLGEDIVLVIDRLQKLLPASRRPLLRSRSEEHTSELQSPL